MMKNNSFGLTAIFFIILLSTNFSVMAQMNADKAGAECSKNITVPQAEIDAVVAGNFDKVTDKGKCYVDCFSKLMNFYTNNVLNEAGVIAFYTTVLPKKTIDEIKKAVSDCKGVEGTGCEKSFNVHKCMYLALSKA